MTARNRTRRPRRRPMPHYEQIELMGCIMLGALIIGLIGGPLAYYITHALT